MSMRADDSKTMPRSMQNFLICVFILNLVFKEKRWKNFALLLKPGKM